MFPTTLREWDSLKRRARSPRAITAVNLAHITNTDSILPSALYSCVLLSKLDLLNGTVHSDGTTDVLGHDDLLRCMHAEAAGTTMSVASIVEWFRAEGCSSSATCEPIWFTLRHETILYMKKTKQHATVLGRWDKIFSNSADDPNPLTPIASALCVDCVKRVCDLIMQSRVVSWYRLPKMFRIAIEGWDEAVE